jgi:hypothetical protein
MNADIKKLGKENSKKYKRKETDIWRFVEIACLNEKGSGGGANKKKIKIENAW